MCHHILPSWKAATRWRHGVTVPLSAKLSQQKYWRTAIYVGTSDEQELHPADVFTGIHHIPSPIAVRH
jgi:hypothetical protein